MASKRSEHRGARVKEKEELTSLGIITAALCHELNNCLSSILTVASLVLEKLPEKDANYEKIRTVVRQAERARSLVRPLARPRFEKVDINQSVAIAVDAAVAGDYFSDLEVRLNLADRVPPVAGDPALIGQAISGIVVHAARSLTAPGVIEIGTESRKGFVEIRVSDSGPGIPEEILKRIFNPLAGDDTMKDTPTGLLISYGIIKRHGGDVSVESVAGEGSTFVVRLPVHG